MAERFWRQYDVDIVSGIRAGCIQHDPPLTVSLDLFIPTEIRTSLLEHLAIPASASGLLSTGSFRGTTRLRHSESFDLDVDVLLASGPLFDIASHKMELAQLTQKLQELLATRKQKTPILGDSILHSFDILAAPLGAVRKKAAEVFASGADEVFEDGMESSFVRNLDAFLKSEGHNALQAAEELIRSPETNKELTFEATRLLGGMDDPGSHISRRKFLEELLDSDSVRLRHAAASGLAAMDDPAALSTVERATNKESNELLKRYLTLVADQLRHLK